MSKFKFEPYSGELNYVFIGCHESCEREAAAMANELASRGFRVYFDVCGEHAPITAQEMAEAMSGCGGLIFFLSPKACGNMEFYNCINYGVNLGKPMTVVMMGDFVPTNGLETQLRHKQKIIYKDTENTADELLHDGVIFQDMRGEGMVYRRSKALRRLVSVAAVLLAALIFGGGMYAGINWYVKKKAAEEEIYRQTPEYIYQNSDGANYLVITQEQGALPVLATIDYQYGINWLDLSNGGFTDIGDISRVKVNMVNVSGNPAIGSLEPLLGCDGLEVVIVSQDMIGMTKCLTDADVTVVVVK